MTLGRRLRRWRMGLATLAGRRPQGFFIPYCHAADVDAVQGPCQPVADLFAAAAAAFGQVLATIDTHAAALTAIAEDAAPPAPRWGQGWFPRLDAAAAYALVRERRPARIVEAGSGHSTRFLARAVADGGLQTRITAIDPAPRAAISSLPVRHIGATVQAALRQDGPNPFAALGPGDIVFIDSSHIAMPGTDVDVLVNRILPTLPAGVLVQIHDIFLPDGYPADWRWRGYNEQLLAAALITGGGYRPLFASRYVATRMAGAVADSVVGRLPLWPGVPESSLWLEKTVPAAGRTDGAPHGDRDAITRG